MTDKVTVLKDTITDYANGTLRRADEIKKGDLTDALRWWHNARALYEEIDEQRKKVYEALEQVSRETLPEMMREQDVKTITLDDLKVRFTINQRFSCSMPDKVGGMAWLRANGLGDIIQETVNAQTLSSAAKKRVEDDGLDMPEQFFKTSYMTFTSATKVK